MGTGSEPMMAAVTADPAISEETVKKGSPVLVELFTSEGCSSCPSADKVLAALPRDNGVGDARVITLGFHVDYWDYLGWKDRFSSAAFSRRQEAYARQFRLDSTYTPQMVVDGAGQFVGSNRGYAIDIISKAAIAAKPTVDLSLTGDKLNIKFGDLPAHTGASVYMAVAENNLSTRPGRGENSGSLLEHAAVVRHFGEAGKIAAGQKTFSSDTIVPTDKDWKAGNLKYVVFVQEDATLKVLAVNEIAR
jgi:hypothetical protein